MKFAIGFLISALSTIALACPEEAQIIASIASAGENTKNSGTCIATIDLKKVRFFAADAQCGLSVETVASEGIVFRPSKGFACSMAKNLEINGLIKRDTQGQLALD